MNDLISRQAAIEAICTEGTRLERNGTVAMCEIKQWCVDILEALPSAQPERVCVAEVKVEGEELQRCIDKAVEQYRQSPISFQNGKRGKWNTYFHGVNDFTYSCNQCGYSAPYGLYGGIYSQRKWAFCPNCGSYNGGDEE